MESAIVRYVPVSARIRRRQGTPLTVDLVGAVHIGDVAYYEAAERRFEAVRRAAVRAWWPPKEPSSNAAAARRTPHPLGAMQNGIK